MFKLDIVEEPAAEPISTHGDGWIPMTIDQVIKTISDDIDTKTEVTTPFAPASKRQDFLTFSLLCLFS